MRGIVVAAVSAAVMVLVASPAAAATASVTSPSSGSTLDGPTPVTVSVQRDPFEDVDSVRVRLATEGGSAYPGSAPASLSCQSGCSGTSTSQSWGGVSFDPRRPSAFGLSQALPNARYRLQPSVGGGSWASGTTVIVSVPPSPVSSLSGTADGHDMHLSWRPAPEPDISGYRVERRKGSGNWAQADQLGPNASSFSETVTSDGDYRYRVVTVRPDGSGGELTATSDTLALEAYGEVRSEPTSAPTERERPSEQPTSGDEDAGAPSSVGDDGAPSDGGWGGVPAGAHLDRRSLRGVEPSRGRRALPRPAGRGASRYTVTARA